MVSSEGQKPRSWGPKSHLCQYGKFREIWLANDVARMLTRSSAFWVWRRFLKGVLTINGRGGNLGYVTRTILNTLSFSSPKESPYEIRVQLAQWF